MSIIFRVALQLLVQLPELIFKRKIKTVSKYKHFSTFSQEEPAPVEPTPEEETRWSRALELWSTAQAWVQMHLNEQRALEMTQAVTDTAEINRLPQTPLRSPMENMLK